MRWFLALLPVLLLVACKPSFDDRYDKAEKDIRAQASGVDSELATQQAGAPRPTDGPTASATRQPPSR